MVQSQLLRKLSGLTRALVRPHSADAPPSPRPARRARAPAPPASLRHLHPYTRRIDNLTSVVVKPDEEVDDVIDLGAPRVVRETPAQYPRERRRRAPYTPNPRLYPGPERKQRTGGKRGGRAPAPPGPRARRRQQRVFRRPVPNARLYRPAPPRPPPPPAAPRAAWPPPPPARALDTASRAALRLGERRGWPAPPPRRAPPPPPRSPARSPPRSPPPAQRSRRLVVTLPAAGLARPAPRSPSPLRERYRPASEHFRLRALPLDPESGASTPPPRPRPRPAPAMDAPRRHSASPEDCSEGNSLSAPSEFLAEFLSAIMRRQYAEALKYCRLILQYEPHNATARGFYPLLQQKLAQQSPSASRVTLAAAVRSDDSGASSGSSGDAAPPLGRASLHDELMEQEADSLASSSMAGAGAGAGGGGARRSASSGSVASQSSLELDSSPERSPERSRRTDPDRTDSASASGSGGWDSSAPSSGRDDNGNPAPATPEPPTCAWDAENNAPRPATPPPRRAAPRPLLLKSEESAASLRRLRAQFACSIK